MDGFFLYIFCNLFMLRESSIFRFGKYPFPVNRHIENTTASLDKFNFRAVILLFNRICQTGSTWIIISDEAVFDGYFHVPSYFNSFIFSISASVKSCVDDVPPRSGVICFFSASSSVIAARIFAAIFSSPR
jgi:hypothetical protein